MPRRRRLARSQLQLPGVPLTLQPLSERLLLQPEVPAGACGAPQVLSLSRSLCAVLTQSPHAPSPPQAYWPFHKAWCRSNDFADAVEATEPKFARWMRKHGKLAVLKDDEVDRIERKVRRTCWGTAGAQGSFA